VGAERGVTGGGQRPRAPRGARGAKSPSGEAVRRSLCPTRAPPPALCRSRGRWDARTSRTLSRTGAVNLHGSRGVQSRGTERRPASYASTDGPAELPACGRNRLHSKPSLSQTLGWSSSSQWSGPCPSRLRRDFGDSIAILLAVVEVAGRFPSRCDPTNRDCYDGSRR
jgi:hypothetical protein